MTDTPFVLQMRGICKRYPGVQALNEAALELRAGEVHVLLGENGASKSTLMKTAFMDTTSRPSCSARRALSESAICARRR